MGELNLKVNFDTTEVDSGFKDIADATKATSKVVQNEAKKQSKVYNDETKKIKPPKPIPQPVSQDKINLVKQLKKEIRDYESAALKAGEGTREFAEAIQKAGEKKAQLKDLKDAVSALDPDTKATAFTNLASTGVQAGQAIAGAFALAGFEGEQYQKLLVRLQGIDAIGNGIRAIGNLGDEWAKAGNTLESYISKIEARIVAEKLSNAVVFIGSAEELELSNKKIAAIQAEIVATNEATIAQRIWNLAKSTGAAGIGILATAIGLTIAVIVGYIASTKKAAEAEKERNRASDGTILANKELRDSYNKLLIVQNEYINAVNVAKGLTSQNAANADNDQFERQQKINLAQSEFVASLKEEGLTRKYNDEIIKNGGIKRVSASGLETLDSSGLKAAKERQKKLNIALEAVDIEFRERAKVRAKEAEVERINEENRLAQEARDNDLTTGLERLKTQKAILELGGKQTFDIQREIVKQEQKIADEKAKTSKDSAEIIAANAERAAQQLLAIDKAYADAQRQFRQQLNGLIIAQMQEGHQNELTLLEENYRNQNETREQFFAREEGSLKAKYDKDLAALNESLRLQRESIQNDGNLSGQQKAELIKELDGSLNKQRLDLEVKFQDDKTKLEKEYDKKRFDESQRNLDARAKQQQDNIQFEVDMIDAQGAIENAHLKGQLGKKLISQAEYDKALQKNELDALKRRRDATLKQDQIEFDRLQEKLRAQQALNEDDSETVKALDAAKKKIALDGLKFQAEIADKSVELVADENEAKKKLQEEAKKDFELIKNAADQIIQEQQDALDKAKELNDAAIAENDRYLETLTDQLKAEQEERALGHANNIDGIKAEIEQEKIERRKNLAEQKLIQSEQAKLNRIKIIEDKAQQASSLITAAANIIQGFSGLPLIGQVLGIAAIGAMLTAFLAFSKKAQAAPGFAKGTKNAPPGLKWVGEEGPELIDDAGGYRIFTNKESERMMRARGLPEYDFTSNISNVLRPKDATDMRGIEKRLDKSNTLLEKGLKKERIVYSGNKKITYSGSTTNITRNYE